MKLAYVSGKYSDERGPYFVREHIEIARQTAMILWALHIPTVCPHTNAYYIDGVLPYDDIINLELSLLDHCDVLLALPSHIESPGAKREIARADEVGIPIYHWPGDAYAFVKFANPSVTLQQIEMAKSIARSPIDVEAVNRLIK